jgi:hypothetical protein
VIFERDFLTFFPWDGWMGLDRMGIKALELEICNLVRYRHNSCSFSLLSNTTTHVFVLSHMFLVRCYARR